MVIIVEVRGSSTSNAAKPTRSCSAASRRRPASRSARARSSRGSQTASPRVRGARRRPVPAVAGPPGGGGGASCRCATSTSWALAEDTLGDLVAAAEAEPDPDRAIRGERGDVGVGGGDAWAWSASFTRAIPASTTASIGGSVEGRSPARPPPPRHLEGSKARIAVALDRGSSAAAPRLRSRADGGGGVRVAVGRRASAASGRCRRRVRAPRQVAAVGEREGPGKSNWANPKKGLRG